MEKNEIKRQCCCFIGHNPERLHVSETEIKKELKREIRDAIEDGFTIFITGMERGIGIIAAETVIESRIAGNPVRLVCACPYQGFEKSWDFSSKCRYLAVLAAADEIQYFGNQYDFKTFMKRSCWMIENSGRVIAFFRGQDGGTAKYIDYARQHHVPVAFCGAF